MTYITGEEMTRYAGELYLEKWIRPYCDTSNWEFYDLSCVSRDNTSDQVLRDAVESGKRIGAIFKEPTITPTAEQKAEFGLKNSLPSPNGLMRSGWNGITISRDTINIPGMDLGYKNKVIFDRHAVGGEYGAGYKIVGQGKTITLFTPNDKNTKSFVIDERVMKDECNAVVLYHNPYDNVTPMARHFFSRCFDAKVTPYVVTKKTVFKWQEEFWRKMKEVFDSEFKEKFLKAGLLKTCGGELQHFLSDVATMQLVRWLDGGFGMCAHNYDGDVLTDEIAQIHRSPGFLTSVLNGVREDGSIIKEFEASHGTVTDMWKAHLNNEETSLNPLSMVEAIIGAMRHSAKLYAGKMEYEYNSKELLEFCDKLQAAIYAQMTTKGRATRDLSGSTGLTTEDFVQAVKDRVDNIDSPHHQDISVPQEKFDNENTRTLFETIDTDGNGTIDFEEFKKGLRILGITNKKIEKILHTNGNSQ